MRILLCDDRDEDRRNTESAINDGAPAGVECKSFGPEELKKAVGQLFSNVHKVIDGKSELATSEFDKYDIIFLDNNLSNLEIPGARLTAEAVVGFVRAFSSTPYVVSLNKNPGVDFDLRYLVGDYATRADLAINTKHLANKALWSGSVRDAHEGFIPWYWPTLQSVAQKRTKQIEFVTKNLDKPILEAFRFPPKAIEVLSRHAVGALSPSTSIQDHISSHEITFLDFFRTCGRSIPTADDREIILAKHLNTVIARVVAADIDLWFRRDVIGPQDILVDLPHLTSRMPFLIGKHSSKLTSWNTAAQATQVPFGSSPTYYNKYLKAHRFPFGEWTNRPVFWWPSIDSTDEWRELFFSEKHEWGDFVFCEDTSTFIDRSGKANEEPHEFVTEFDSPWNRRHVRKLKNFKYSPSSRFAS